MRSFHQEDTPVLNGYEPNNGRFALWSPRSPHRLWEGLRYRDLVSGEGGGRSSPQSGLVRCAARGSRLRCRAQRLCTRPAAAILNWRARAQYFCAQDAAELSCAAQPFCMRSSGLRPLPAVATCEQVKRDEAQGKNKRLDFILLLRFYFCFPGIVNELCWWHKLLK